LIQADFAAIGVEAEIVSMEWGEYLKQSSALDRDGAVLLGWTGDNGDPDNFLAVLLGCDGVGANNRAQWCYQPFEDLIQKAKGTSDQEARTDPTLRRKRSSRSRRLGRRSPILLRPCR
jgi:dipeptide transport system substrate-binding protein